jgi:uncharacterized repeat protein (TIGR01451 family)
MFTAVTVLGGAGCTSDSGGSAQSRDDRGGASPASDTIVGRRDGGTDRVRAASSSDEARGGEGALRHTLAFPTGDRRTSLLMLEADAPEQVRVGQQYSYTLRVTNLTDTPLHGVEVRDMGHQASRAAADTAAADTAAAGERPGERAGDQPSDRSSHRAGTATWNVGTLAPKETQSKQFNATADEVGTVGNCLSVSYNPTLCMAVRVVKPELQIVKTGPDRAMICEDIPYTYRVTNTGTGIARDVRVEDALPEGLSAPQGGPKPSITVGNLDQGQSKDVTVRLRAARTGKFTSRAVARSAGAEAYSREVTTTVVEPALAVAVEGPESRYVGEAVDYRVTVRNTGDAPAEKTVVKLSAPGGTERLTDRDIGTIAPGEAKTFTVSTRAGREAGDLRLTAAASARCAREATNMASVAIRVVPALRLECVDTVDPVRIDGTTAYTIKVTNTGTGPDTNVSLGATVPPELQFVRQGTGGTTQVQANGAKLKFGTVPTLAAGASATWSIEVKAVKAGDARFGIEMISDSLTKPVDESESTRVIEK